MRTHFEDFYAERSGFEPVNTAVPVMPFVGAATKTAQEYGQDPVLVNDYKAIVETLRGLKHPKVQQKLYDWIKMTFKKTPRAGGSSEVIDANFTPTMQTVQDVIAPQSKGSVLSTSSSPRQLSAFKGQTTKLGKKK